MTTTPVKPEQAPDTAPLYSHFIGGKRVTADGDPDLTRENPARTDQVVGTMKSADQALVSETVRVAASAWEQWRNTPAPTRGKILHNAARIMDERREELARLITVEEGKSIREARGEVQRAINITEFMAGEGRRFGGYTSASESVGKFAFTTRQPLGVVAAITPWNFPLAIPAWKLAPMLIAGNAVILKPARSCRPPFEGKDGRGTSPRATDEGRRAEAAAPTAW